MSSPQDLSQIKELMHKYDRIQRASQETASLRKKLIPMLKSAGLSKTKFNFGDRTIGLNTYNSYEEVTQRLIRSVIVDKYPQLDAEQFVTDLYAARKRRSIDTLKITVIKRK